MIKCSECNSENIRELEPEDRGCFEYFYECEECKCFFTKIGLVKEATEDEIYVISANITLNNIKRKK